MTTRVYNSARFTIGTIYIESESKHLMYKEKYESEIKLNYKNEDDHVIEAERNNHNIKYRV